MGILVYVFELMMNENNYYTNNEGQDLHNITIKNWPRYKIRSYSTLTYIDKDPLHSSDHNNLTNKLTFYEREVIFRQNKCKFLIHSSLPIFKISIAF